MTEAALRHEFEHWDDQYLHFERIENKRSQRPDLHAFVILDELLPRDRDMVTAAEHDQIWLDIEAQELAPVATPELVLELVRCGVRIDEDGSLVMYA